MSNFRIFESFSYKFLAFSLLLKSVESHFDCARVWLRLAECCIAHHCSNSRDTHDQEPILREIGEGCARLVIANAPSENRFEFQTLKKKMSTCRSRNKKNA